MSVIHIKESNEIAKSFGIDDKYLKENLVHIESFHKQMTDKTEAIIRKIVEKEDVDDELETNISKFVNQITQELFDLVDPVRPQEFAWLGYIVGASITSCNLKTQEMVHKLLMRKKLGGLGDLLRGL